MMKRAGKPAGDDFEDNREPGKGRKRLWSLTRRPELDNQISIGIAHSTGFSGALVRRGRRPKVPGGALRTISRLQRGQRAGKAGLRWGALARHAMGDSYRDLV